MNESVRTEKNLQPVITQVTPIHSPIRPESSQNESALSPSLISNKKTEVVENNKALAKSAESADASEDEEEDDDEDEDVRELEGRTVTAKGQMVSKRST